MELALGSNETQPTLTTDAYVHRDAEGNIIRRPLEDLSPIDRANARPYEGTKLHEQCPQICDWFTGYTGVSERADGTVTPNSLRSYAWLKHLKGFMPTLGSDLIASDEQGVLGYRMWSIIPKPKPADKKDKKPYGDLSVEANLAAFNETGIIPMVVLPLSSAIGVKAENVKADEKYQVPRLAHKNVVLVKYARNEDGSVKVDKVFANYFLRLQFKNKNWKVPYTNTTTGETKNYDSQIFANATMRRMADVTKEFDEVFAQVKEQAPDKDLNELVHITLGEFFRNPQLATTKLARIMSLQARSMVAAHVDALEGGRGSAKWENNLADRVQMYAVEVRDCYHGIERNEGKDAEDEFLDYHCRVMQVFDPVLMNAHGLSGTKRINGGTRIVF